MRAAQAHPPLCWGDERDGVVAIPSRALEVLVSELGEAVRLCLVNVLLTIIIEGYERVKKELEGKGNELEVRNNPFKHLLHFFLFLR